MRQYLSPAVCLLIMGAAITVFAPSIARSQTQPVATEPSTCSWSQPDDPIEVRTLLDKYAAATVPQRKGIIVRLSVLPDKAGFPALARLFVQEPNEDLRWVMVSAMWSYIYTGRLACAFEPRVPWGKIRIRPAWLWPVIFGARSIRAKAIALFSRCIDQEFARPGRDSAFSDGAAHGGATCSARSTITIPRPSCDDANTNATRAARPASHWLLWSYLPCMASMARSTASTTM